MTYRHYDIFETRFGWMGLLFSDKGLIRSSLPEESEGRCVLSLGVAPDRDVYEPERVARLRERLMIYFEGVEVGFDDIALDMEDAPEFHRKAWDACRSIPRGETRTYKWLAKMAGSPNAPRAAGQTMARNRVPIIVPCHRVIGSDGSMRGFGSGDTRIDLKRRLLELEGARMSLF